MSYFNERIYNQMDVTANDIITNLIVDDRFGTSTERSGVRIFTDDDKGNIKILYYNLHRVVRTIYNRKKEERKTTTYGSDDFVSYYRTRLSPDNIQELQAKDPDREVGKYVSPKGEGVFPWWPPKVIELYENKEQVNTLVLTEGEFKSFVGSMEGLAVVGMPSITCFVDSESHILDRDISEFIRVCHVKNVIILHDGDCRDISTKQLRKGGDLRKRPEGFINAAANAREALLNEGVGIYYAYVNTKRLAMNEEGEQPKGLDDLLRQPYYRSRCKEIIEELNDVTIKSGIYFVKFDIFRGTTNIFNHFGLKNAKTFFDMHRDEIGNHTFKFNETRYKYNEEEDELEKDETANIQQYIRVGDYYYKKVMIPNRHNPDKLEEQLKFRQKGTVLDDFSNDKKLLAHIAKYEDFVVAPSHERYQDTIYNCYNLYKRIPWHPTGGDFPHIDFLMHHIFGDQYEIGMDYMQLLYKKPRQILPILCLVSKERMTGKTTFINLLQDIYQENCFVSNNDDINSNFNSNWAGKLLVCMDETKQRDNQQLTEKLKTVSTARDIVINAKGKDQVVVSNFIKFVLCSNYPTEFLYIEKDEVRFWIREIPSLPDSKKISNWNDVVRDEIPAFLGYINTRQMLFPIPKTRMWFDFADIRTEAFDNLINAQISGPEYTLYKWLFDYFVDNEIEEFWITRKLLEKCVKFREVVKDKRFDRAISKVFKKDKYDVKIRENGSKVETIYCTVTTNWIDENTPVTESDKGRGYHLVARELLSESDYKHLRELLEEKTNKLNITPNTNGKWPF